MALLPLRLVLAALVGLLSLEPLADARRVAVSELAHAGADKARGLRPLKAWIAAAAATALLGDAHGARPPPQGLAATPSLPAVADDARSTSKLHVQKNLLKKWGGKSKDKRDKKKKKKMDRERVVRQINEYGEEYFGGVLRCSWAPGKGRIVRATRDFALGEEIFTEDPLKVVREPRRSDTFRRLKQLCREHPDAFEHEPLYYWCAIQSLTKEQLKDAPLRGCRGTTPEIQHKLLQLHHEVKQPSEAAEIIVQELTPCADMLTIERLVDAWTLNCFEFTEDPPAVSAHYFSSFMSHSCLPNAIWYHSGAAHVLRARRDIKAGDEVCISYLPENTLLQAAPARRMELHKSHRFWCDCERCRPGRRDLSRGVKCPGCREGTIFAKTPPAGPAKDASLLPSHWRGACCDRCRHVVRKEHARKLAAYERKAQEILDRSSGNAKREVEDLKKDEEFLDKFFPQHVLADLAREQIGLSYAAKRRGTDELRQLVRRAEFSQAAYPGLSVATAEALEALGDCLASGEEIESDPDAARHCYAEALAILRLMFGETDGYDTDVSRKLLRLGS